VWVVVGWMVCRRVGSADRACTRRETQGEDWAFARCARGGGVRFQCSFRLDPLTLGQFSVGDQGPMAGGGVGLFGGWFVGAWGRIIVVEQIRGVWLWVVVG
jgi:hypothetical protein